MKTVTLAAAALIAIFAASGSALANDPAVPQTTHAAKAIPQAKNTKRPVRTPILDSLSTGSIATTAKRNSDPQSKATATQSGIAVNPWIMQNIF